MQKKTPPYLSYRTLRNFLESIRATAVPTRIDRSILRSMSGSNQVLLLSAVRYLGLVDQTGVPTPDLQRLVSAEGQERRQVWRRILMKTYPELFDPSIDLSRTTTQELMDVFERLGTSSKATISKCVTFFSLAVKDAGIVLSPYVKPYAGRPRTRAAIDDRESKVGVRQPLEGGSLRFQELLAKFPNFDPSWPEQERNNWVRTFKEIGQFMMNGSSYGEESEVDDQHKLGVLSAE